MLKTISTLVSGIGIFIFSIYLINSSISDDSVFKSPRFTTAINRPLAAMLTGLLSSMITQSSSAINSVAVQLADKGLLKKNNRYFIVMGTNVGTTITAYFAVLGNVNFANIFLLLMPVTAILLMVNRREKYLKTELAVCAFFMIFVGINIISSTIPNLVSAINLSVIESGNKLNLLFFSTLITAVCQSSSVISMIIVMLCHSGTFGVETAMFLIMGANIGTCTTAYVAAIGKSGDGKAVATFNLIFNLVGLVTHTFAYYTGLLDWFIDMSVTIDTKIAMYHTFFNLSTILFFIPVFYKKSPVNEKKKPTYRRFRKLIL